MQQSNYLGNLVDKISLISSNEKLDKISRITNFARRKGQFI